MKPFDRRQRQLLLDEFNKRFSAVKRFPNRPRDFVKRHQFTQIKKLLHIAYHHTQFYRSLYDHARIKPEDIRTFQDFQFIPFVTKDMLIDAGADMIDRRKKEADLFVSTTSGSSGKVAKVFLDDMYFIKQHLQVIRMLQEMYPNYGATDRELLVYTSCYPFCSINGAYPVTYINNLASSCEIIEKIRRTRPTVMAIYPSVLRELQSELSNARELGLRLILLNSEQSSPLEREQFREFFGCTVLDEFSTEELSSIAHQCPQGIYHLVEDSSFIEIAHPKEHSVVSNGSEGEIVGTCLLNEIQPLIRYRQGDLARLSSAQCPCGKLTPVVQEFNGRCNDSFRRPDGISIPSGKLLDWTYSLLLKERLEFHEFSLVQTSLSGITLEVSLKCGAVGSEMLKVVKRSFLDIFGRQFSFDVRVVDTIRKENGKHRPIRCLV